jgi:hypothetical protein
VSTRTRTGRSIGGHDQIALRAAFFSALLTFTAIAVACSGIQQAFDPLPPSNTLDFQAFLMPGEVVAGSRTIRMAWMAPDESVDSVVIEESSDGLTGPWAEIATITADRGFHQESAIYRSGNAYYFRAFLVRGNEDATPSEAIRVWIPYEPQHPTSTPLPAYTPTPVPVDCDDPESTATVAPVTTPTPESDCE